VLAHSAREFTQLLGRELGSEDTEDDILAPESEADRVATANHAERVRGRVLLEDSRDRVRQADEQQDAIRQETP